jgi:hypothetical protein
VVGVDEPHLAVHVDHDPVEQVEVLDVQNPLDRREPGAVAE